MSQCENIDGQCGASWCDCDYQRKKRALVSNPPTPEEIDREAVSRLELRHSLAQPDRPGYWRGAPNPFAVPYKENDDGL